MPSSFEIRRRIWTPRLATLIHNPTAGDGRPTGKDLERILADAGFQVRYQSSKGDWRKAVDEAADLIVAAGGDGTVAKVFRRVCGRDMPVAVLADWHGEQPGAVARPARAMRASWLGLGSRQSAALRRVHRRSAGRQRARCPSSRRAAAGCSSTAIERGPTRSSSPARRRRRDRPRADVAAAHRRGGRALRAGASRSTASITQANTSRSRR